MPSTPCTKILATPLLITVKQEEANGLPCYFHSPAYTNLLFPKHTDIVFLEDKASQICKSSTFLQLYLPTIEHPLQLCLGLVVNQHQQHQLYPTSWMGAIVQHATTTDFHRSSVMMTLPLLWLLTCHNHQQYRWQTWINSYTND